MNDGVVQPEMSPKAVTVRLKRVSQLRALFLSLAEAGRRGGLHDRSTTDLATGRSDRRLGADPTDSSGTCRFRGLLSAVRPLQHAKYAHREQPMERQAASFM